MLLSSAVSLDIVDNYYLVTANDYQMQERLADGAACRRNIALTIKDAAADIGMDPMLHDTCSFDLQKFCHDVPAGEAKQRVKKGYRVELKVELLAQHSDLKLSTHLKEACFKDVLENCKKKDMKQAGCLGVPGELPSEERLVKSCLRSA